MKSEKQIKEKRAKETLEILECGFTTERRIHNGYREYESAKKKFNHIPLKLIFGKYQYVFTKGDLKISLIKFNDSPLLGKKDKWFWEIYAYEDKRLFDDIRKFSTKKAAVEEIKKILSD